MLQEVYDVYGIFEEKNEKLVNFKSCEEEGFYPVLFGEEAYNFTCLKAKKIS